MIKVDRNRVRPPDVLTALDGAGQREIERARKSLTDWMAQGNDAAKWSFTFSAYSHVEVKRKLEELFHRKCAYCESTYGATQPMDVEHWRPKGAVEGEAAGDRVKPAYYWLAATWANLLPSCIDCNRRRKQIDAMTDIERLIGKEDQFPLDSGSPRASAPEQVEREVPLLLNPCEDDPGAFLEFTDEGVLKPSAPDGLDQRKARASIDVYALNRSGLVLTRKELIRHVKLRFARIERIVRLLQEPGLPDHLNLILDELLVAELRELARMRRADQPYSLLAQQLIDRWMEETTTLGIPSAALATPPVPGRAE